MNQENTNSKPSEGGLDWLAFCYVADELESSDREQFELRLESDHEAREAVVRAMEQAELIWLAVDSERLANPMPVVRSRKDSNLARRSGILAACAAALLVMVGAWGWYANQDQGTSTGELDSEAVAVAVAELIESEDIDEFIEEQIDFGFDDDSSDADDEISDFMFIALTDMEASSEVIE